MFESAGPDAVTFIVTLGSWKLVFGATGPGTRSTSLPLSSATVGVPPYPKPGVRLNVLSVAFVGTGSFSTKLRMLLSVAPLPMSGFTFEAAGCSDMLNVSPRNTVAGASATTAWEFACTWLPSTGTFRARQDSGSVVVVVTAPAGVLVSTSAPIATNGTSATAASTAPSFFMRPPRPCKPGGSVGVDGATRPVSGLKPA